MKFTLLLITFVIVAMPFACLLAMLHQHDKSTAHRTRRVRVRPFTALERLALPFIGALHRLGVAWNGFWGGNRLALANAIATCAGPNDTKFADEAIGRRTVVKFGSDADHIGVCDAADIPLGATRDASAAAAADRVSFAQFGLYHEELEGTASGEIADGDFVVPANGGALRSLTGLGAGTYYICGRAKGAAADGAALVYVPCFPIQRVVAG
jgi:hypothetical protein